MGKIYLKKGDSDQIVSQISPITIKGKRIWLILEISFFCTNLVVNIIDVTKTKDINKYTRNIKQKHCNSSCGD